MCSKLRSTGELIQLVRARKKAGAEALYDQYAKVLHFAIFRIVPQKELADGLLEKVFVEIWDNFGLYNEHDLPLLSWMLAITKNLAHQQQSNEIEKIELR
jgi:DNA-directed RNA polymerase specialized sigma24 family protein